MFAVKPLPDKEIQKELCQRLGTEYCENTMAYFAVELSEDRESITEIIGICQFTPGDEAVMNTLFPADGKEKDEAMVIMARAVMNFLWRIGSKTMLLPSSAGPEALLKSCGLIPCKDGYIVDLDEFYKSPCHYNKEN